MQKIVDKHERLFFLLQQIKYGINLTTLCSSEVLYFFFGSVYKSHTENLADYICVRAYMRVCEENLSHD